jgi:hypothetical protein
MVNTWLQHAVEVENANKKPPRSCERGLRITGHLIPEVLVSNSIHKTPVGHPPYLSSFSWYSVPPPGCPMFARSMRKRGIPQRPQFGTSLRVGIDGPVDYRDNLSHLTGRGDPQNRRRTIESRSMRLSGEQDAAEVSKISKQKTPLSRAGR